MVHAAERHGTNLAQSPSKGTPYTLSGVGRRLGSVAAVVLGMVGSALGQLTPDRTYYGVDRPMPMTVARPAGQEGEISIRLLAPVSAEERESAAASEGSVDLLALFPVLAKPEPAMVLYAQLVVGETKVGPAVVLQPLVTPKMAIGINPQTQNPYWQEGPRLFSGYRAYVDRHVVLDTTEGEIAFAMRPDMAPNTAWNFMNLAEGGFYTDIIFHRIIDSREGRAPFVIQVGDPTGTGAGGPGQYIDMEPSTLPHDFGVLSMARTGNEPNSNGSQVFICLSRQGTSFLDGKYTSFAQAVSGAEAIRTIASAEVTPDDRPVSPPVMKGARLVDAPPYGGAPAPLAAPAAEPVER